MKLLFSIHVEIMCDLSQLIIFLVKGGGRHETIYKANFIVIVIINLCR